MAAKRAFRPIRVISDQPSGRPFCILKNMEEEFEIRDLRKKEKFLVDDAYLNGYAKICGIYATGVYISLCRHANRNQESHPSLSKIAEELNISVKQVGRAIKILEQHNIIKKVRVGKKANNRYYLLDKSVWTTSPITNNSDWTVSPITMDCQSNHYGLTVQSNSKETHSKETHSKDIAVANATATDISKIINFFKEVSPLTYKDWFGNKTERKASAELLNRLPMDKLEVLITKILPRLNVTPYISKNCKAFKPSELLRNLDRIIAKVKELQQKRSQEKINIEI